MLKFKEKTNLKVSLKDSIIGFVGGFMVILILLFLTELSKVPLIMAPFGASCVLVFGVPKSPLSQPRNVIGGHFLSTLVGLSVQELFGNSMYAIAFATGFAIFIMMMTKTTHPPAGADALVVMLSQVSWSFLFMPVLVGSIVVVCVAVVVNRMVKGRQYPEFWY